MKPRAAVIDVGSNSIKALVAERGNGPFEVVPVMEDSREVRISQGISGDPPHMHADRIEAGAEAVRELWNRCGQHGPLAADRIVATSAVRTVNNGDVFVAAVEAATGKVAEVLSGAEEADGIAIGVRTDPAIEDHLDDFTVFDLGGGSLELIRFEKHGVTERTSLPLGAVRLTEEFITDPANPIPRESREAIVAHLREHIAATGATLTAPLVGCSGGLVAVRQILAGDSAMPLQPEKARIGRDAIRALGESLITAPISDRLALPGMPPRRADILPAALIVFELLMELAGADEIRHSLHNLRYGLVLRLLDDVTSGR